MPLVLRHDREFRCAGGLSGVAFFGFGLLWSLGDTSSESVIIYCNLFWFNWDNLRAQFCSHPLYSKLPSQIIGIHQAGIEHSGEEGVGEKRMMRVGYLAVLTVLRELVPCCHRLSRAGISSPNCKARRCFNVLRLSRSPPSENSIWCPQCKTFSLPITFPQRSTAIFAPAVACHRKPPCNRG